MRIVFMGSADFSRRSLDALCADGHHRVVGAVTQPDRPKGRDLKAAACPAKALAVQRGVPVLSPANVNEPDSLAAFRALAPDLIVVVAYGQILKQDLLDLPPRGCINVHASLLPKYRGAAPIPWAIARGERVTGVTIMHMAKKMDAGDIILQESVPIADDDTGGSLHDKLAEAGAALLVKAVAALSLGGAPRRPQDEREATYAPKLAKEDGRIDWTRPAQTLCDTIRAFNPRPCCFCGLPRGGGLRILRTRVEDAAGAAGAVLDAAGEGPLVAAGDRALRLLDVQPEGRKAMTGTAYLNGHALKKGDRLL